MHNKCSNKTELNCNAKQCFYEDYWKFMTRVHHDMTHNAWAMSIGDLRVIRDNISSLLYRTISLTNNNEVYDDDKTENNIKYYRWLNDVQYILYNLDNWITEWINVTRRVHNVLDEFTEQNECPFLESPTGKKAMGVTSKNFKI